MLNINTTSPSPSLLGGEYSKNPPLKGAGGCDEPEGINVLSLFDGMSCGQIALNRLGIKVRNYFASEVDKYAMQVTQANFPDTIQLGDIVLLRQALCWKKATMDKFFGSPYISEARKNRFRELQATFKGIKIDLLIGGTPCQGFSFAGKGLNFNDPRSKLFFDYVHLLRVLKPTYFLLENVRMKKEYEMIISRKLGVEPLIINSALVSAQNRVRLYWTNIGGLFNKSLFGNATSIIPQPQDRGILLKDILEKEVEEKYFLSKKMIQGFSKHADIQKDKGNNFEWNLRSTSTYLKISTKGNPKSNQDKASCFTAGAHSGGNHSDMDLLVQIGNVYDEPQNPQAGRVYDADYKSVTLKGEGGGGGAKTGLYLVKQLNPSLESGNKQPYQQNRVYAEEGKMVALDTDFTKNVFSNCRIRRLTPLECKRLQTVDDDYIMPVSDTRKYKMLGDGWTVEVVAHIFSYANFAKKEAFARSEGFLENANH